MKGVLRLKPKNQQLAEEYGGTWKYDGCSTWWCDDGKRHVSRTHGCFGCDDDDCTVSPSYYLYGDGTPKMVFFDSPFTLKE